MKFTSILGLAIVFSSLVANADFGSDIEKCLVKKKKSALEYCINLLKAERSKSLEERYHFAVVGARKHGSSKRKSKLRDELTSELEAMNLFIDYLQERRKETVDYRKKAHAIRVATENNVNLKK